MRFSPEEIESRDFDMVVRGYDREQVRAFLADIASEYRDPPSEAATEAFGKEVGGVLSAAKAAAEAIVAEANKEAEAVRAKTEDLRTSTERETAQLKAQADEESASMLTAAKEQVERMLDTAREQARTLVEVAEARAAEVVSAASAEAERRLADTSARVDRLTLSEQTIQRRLYEVMDLLLRSLTNRQEPTAQPTTAPDATSAAEPTLTIIDGIRIDHTSTT